MSREIGRGFRLLSQDEVMDAAIPEVTNHQERAVTGWVLRLSKRHDVLLTVPEIAAMLGLTLTARQCEIYDQLTNHGEDRLMALHGDIKVNGQQIAYWDAQRVNGEPPGWCEYRWRYSIMIGGTPKVFGGTLMHRYDAGAHALAATVLRLAECVLTDPSKVRLE